MNLLTRVREKVHQPGTLLLGYSIHSVIGMGSYGVLYLATSPKTNKQVIIKQLRCRKLTKAGRESFNTEKEILIKLSHPSLPKLLDSFTYLGKPYLVMSKVYGDNLDKLIFKEKKLFSKEESFLLLEEVVKVVQYFHNNGIVHQDLRPPNIIVDGRKIGIIDFGLADFINLDTELPSPSLMREKLPKSDFYALGHTLLFVLYSSYSPSSKKKRTWEDELDLSKEEKHFIRRLLQIEEPFENVAEVLLNLHLILNR
ncbi:serine/threonine protein kinase [Fredinandcohnia sp. 179-A 10B2 NHS]|uniref:serine/threonine protein kinase n=1 Tax=Fredinandcohnia sp. 179-A 10B2 NHS TaxID=3235176 RepID=UPI00399F3E85